MEIQKVLVAFPNGEGIKTIIATIKENEKITDYFDGTFIGQTFYTTGQYCTFTIAPARGNNSPAIEYK